MIKQKLTGFCFWFETMIITSRSNKTAKLISSLSQKKYRDKTGYFVAEGKRSVDDILRFAPELVREIVTVPSLADEYPGATVFSPELLSAVCETVTAQGVAAILKKPDGKPSGCDRALLLDGVRDPGNLGTLIRTACAAGYNDVYVKDCADAYSGKTVRSTMSAIVKVNLIKADARLLRDLSGSGYRIIGADMDGKSVFGRPPERGRFCLVIGGEANGISEEVMELCDEKVSVPMTGSIESLNAAVSGAVLMYELINGKII